MIKKILNISIILIFILSSCSDADISPYDMWDDFEDTENSENYTDYGENPFINTADQAVSTFAIDADGASYSNMRRFIRSGEKPPKESVRIEEFINFFRFDYPDAEGEAVSINTESATCPWNNEHYLLRIGLKGKGIESKIPSNFVFLIDVSGSMDSDDKLGILKDGFKKFAQQLDADDRVAIVTYAGEAGLLLPSTPGNQTDIICAAIDKLGAGGSTAGAEGIITAYEIAEENFIEGGNNRVILGSDGDFNVGISSTEDLIELIEDKRNSGVFFTVLGVGTGNLNDAMMEQIANNGNGNYEYIDAPEQLEKVFIYDYDKFFTVAKDAKIQITFNTESVEKYRLIGYENRLLENQEFENDSTDAGEIGANQTITALYEIQAYPDTDLSQFADLEFRYKKPDEDNSRLIAHIMNHPPKSFENASPNMQFAASVAAFGMLLRESEFSGTASYQDIITWAENSKAIDPYGLKAQFKELVLMASRL